MADLHDAKKQHNSSAGRQLLQTIRPGIPQDKEADYDALVQIVFKDVEDYMRVRNDPHFVNVVDPDHANFAHPKKTKFVTGWFEYHVADGQLVSP